MRIATLGPKGTYSDKATFKYNPDAEVIYADSHNDVFEKVIRGEADEGVIAVENQLEGTVVENLDNLYHYPLFINHEIVIKIHHNLLTLPSTRKVSTIMSHPQAISQCRRYLSEHYPKAKILQCASTATALKSLCEKKRSSTAVIGSTFAADYYGLKVTASQIEDLPYNATRFLVVSPKELREGSKTSILFICARSHTSGSLWHCLKSLAKHKVNLMKIESRPIRERSWEYLFFIDLDGGLQQENVRAALKDLQEHTTLLKVLGSYAGEQID